MKQLLFITTFLIFSITVSAMSKTADQSNLLPYAKDVCKKNCLTKNDKAAVADLCFTSVVFTQACPDGREIITGAAYLEFDCDTFEVYIFLYRETGLSCN